MPVLHFPLERLQAALGKETDEETLRERIPLFGCPVEESQGPEWSVEVFPDRPDLLSAELLGRALRAYLGYEPGLDRYDLAEPTEELVIDPSVESVRPVIVCGAAHGINLDEDGLKALMDLQEDLHWGLGARRRKVSVGIHDARDIQGPYTYKAVDPDTVSFVPLRETEEMTMREMLEGIEKGQDYAHLVEDHDQWPLIVDADDKVLSFPPIINGTVTTLREGTTDVFVDVTGTDERACRQVLNIIMA
ncbi:MAG: phenylalanine--tRNA ligase beta subunit-related protein, partial [Candidatus Thermoplasmatota archaeon]|nr:phenylalanine--tRNA ligase beta subunit-related protein [Candidatus Thermoplasmatota archaeon]